jgi:hypothetical protein
MSTSLPVPLSKIIADDKGKKRLGKQEGDPSWIAFKIAQDRGRTIADSTEKSSDSAKGAAKSAAIDPELAELAAVWPSLSAIIKSVILGVARQHLETGKPKK